MPNGKKVCVDFNNGNCIQQKKAMCDKGMHKCSKINNRGLVCGIPFHHAMDCRKGWCSGAGGGHLEILRHHRLLMPRHSRL